MSEWGQPSANYCTPEGAAYLAAATAKKVYWTEPGLKITRLRMLTERGYPYLDISYCHGVLDGTPCTVQLPFGQLTKTRWKSEIIAFAKKDNVYAKGLGILENISVLG